MDVRSNTPRRTGDTPVELREEGAGHADHPDASSQPHPRIAERSRRVVRTAHEVTGGRDHRARPLRRSAQGLAALVLAAGGLVLAAPGASAAIVLEVIPTFPDPVAVGQMNVAATLSITNMSTSSTGGVFLSTTTLVPACGTIDSTGSCPMIFRDPGVFQLSDTGFGATGTACAGMTFTIATIEPTTGRVEFNPSSVVMLGPPGSPTATCRIDFTFDVLKLPTRDATAATGISTFQLGFTRSSDGTTVGSGSGADETQVLPQAQGVPLVAPQVAAAFLGPLALAGGLVVFRRRRRPALDCV